MYRLMLIILVKPMTGYIYEIVKTVVEELVVMCFIYSTDDLIYINNKF